VVVTEEGDGPWRQSEFNMW